MHESWVKERWKQGWKQGQSVPVAVAADALVLERGLVQVLWLWPMLAFAFDELVLGLHGLQQLDWSNMSSCGNTSVHDSGTGVLYVFEPPSRWQTSHVHGYTMRIGSYSALLLSISLFGDHPVEEQWGLQWSALLLANSKALDAEQGPGDEGAA